MPPMAMLFDYYMRQTWNLGGFAQSQQETDMSYDDQKEKALEIAMAAARVAYDQGYGDGATKGVEEGIRIGFVMGVQSVQAALSDGLRHGSPECGRALEGMKRLGINKED